MLCRLRQLHNQLMLLSDGGGGTIGDCAVIGANSFVNRDIPAFAIAIGSPAKVVRFRWSEIVRNAVQASQYWRFAPKEARAIIRGLSEAWRP